MKKIFQVTMNQRLTLLSIQKRKCWPKSASPATLANLFLYTFLGTIGVALTEQDNSSNGRYNDYKFLHGLSDIFFIRASELHLEVN